MSKLIASIVAVALGAGVSASGSLIAYEGFNMTAGDVFGQAGATSSGWNGNWAGQDGVTASPSAGKTYGTLPTVAGGSTITTAATGTGAYRLLSAPVNSGTIWVSFLGQVAEPSTSGFAGVELYSGATERFLFGEDWVGVTWGVNKGGQLAESLVPSSTQAFCVVQLNITTNGGAGTLYVNPTLGAAAPTGGTTKNFNYAGDGTFDRVAVRGGLVSSYDEIRLGTTWADVSLIPEPASLGMAAIGGLTLLLRRRRA